MATLLTSHNLDHTSTSTSSRSSKQTKQKKKKKPRGNPPQSTAVDDLVSRMGLTPARKKPPSKKPPNSKPDSATPLPSLKAQLEYARNGHTVLRQFIRPNKNHNPSRLDDIRQELSELGKQHELHAWRQKVQVASNNSNIQCQTIDECRQALDRLGVPSQLPFLQYFNTWRTLPCVYELAEELAETAAILLDVPSVRLYQDSCFWKRSQDGPTPWHVDARMAPFDTSAILTIWIPLHDVSDSGLHFVSKSHADFALPFWNPFTTTNNKKENPWNDLETRYQHYKIQHYMPLKQGDVTVHSGWTLHCADGGGEDRLALAISYVDAKAHVRPHVLKDHGDDEDQWSYKDWVQDVPAGTEFEHPLVPIVWPPRQQQQQQQQTLQAP
ncbi:Phytanoyl-CoA dioxygenase (PhyH) [Seminavis robusta]|uniref:Phytanoyl-CoA dioxygenase (PhyH) n=1 Tax=Seminavis robusta TaxID=568900 RepID=A0A9N8DLM3_9STRA|nr:Phytanoyl-CoA dioxygenase (PhyH) [Seminavis robusta]|eukprot:Sro200_g084660.1 Phytanoyl-CoA dioxygenase (PhyH) (383) ;mRNA; r:30914-32062